MILSRIFLKNGFNDVIKDDLAAMDDRNSLDSLISSSIKIDNCLREHRRERAHRPQSCSIPYHPSPPITRTDPNNPPASASAAISLPYASSSQKGELTSSRTGESNLLFLPTYVVPRHTVSFTKLVLCFSFFYSFLISGNHHVQIQFHFILSHPLLL